MHPPAGDVDLIGRALVMDHALTGSHPLNFARTHLTGISKAVLVLRSTFQKVAYGLYAGMRMRWCTLCLSRSKVVRTEMIEEDKRP
jgi:hypothetical protein